MKKIFPFLALALSTSAFAENDPYQACLDKAGVSTDGIIELCAEKASEAYKKQITKSYNTIYANYQKTEPEKVTAFEEAQKAWLVNRNKNCEISDNKQKCLMDSNKQRAEEFFAKEAALKSIESTAALTNIPQITTKRDLLFNKSKMVKLNDCDGQENVWTISATMDRTNIDWIDSILFERIVGNDAKSPITRADAVKALEKQFNNPSFEEYCTSGDLGRKTNVSFVSQFSKFATFDFDVWDWFPEYGNVFEEYTVGVTVDLEKKKKVTFVDLFPKSNKKKLEALVMKKIEAEGRFFNGEVSIDDNELVALSESGIGFYLGRNSGTIEVEWKEVKSLLLSDVKQYIQ